MYYDEFNLKRLEEIMTKSAINRKKEDSFGASKKTMFLASESQHSFSNFCKGLKCDKAGVERDSSYVDDLLDSVIVVRP